MRCGVRSNAAAAPATVSDLPFGMSFFWATGSEASGKAEKDDGREPGDRPTIA